jgi:hypothetical protein
MRRLSTATRFPIDALKASKASSMALRARTWGVAGEGIDPDALVAATPCEDQQIDAEAESLIRQLGGDAYAEALRKESESSSASIARDWSRVAQAIAKRTGLDAAPPTSMDADVARSGPIPTLGHRAKSELSPLDQLNRSVSARPQQFRVQFVGATRGREPLVLKEVAIEAADVSGAIVAAASLRCRPRRRDCISLTAKTARSLHARRPIHRNRWVERRQKPRLVSSVVVLLPPTSRALASLSFDTGLYRSGAESLKYRLLFSVTSAVGVVPYRTGKRGLSGRSGGSF